MKTYRLELSSVVVLGGFTGVYEAARREEESPRLRRNRRRV